MSWLDVICYLGTAFTLISYCFRAVKLRILILIGNCVNIIWAVLAQETPILVSNLLYLVINIYGLIREIKLQKKG